jgi:hypothetical protein
MPVLDWSEVVGEPLLLLNLLNRARRPPGTALAAPGPDPPIACALPHYGSTRNAMSDRSEPIVVSTI